MSAPFEFAGIPSLLEQFRNPLMHYAPAFLNFIARTLKGAEVAYLTSEHQGGNGYLPLAVTRHAEYGSVVNSLPFFGSHGGPFANTPAVKSELLCQFSDIARAHGVVSATLIENPFDPIDGELMARLDFKCVDERIGQFTSLPAFDEDLETRLFERFHVKTRNAIRKGMKLGQAVENREDSSAWCWIHGVHSESIAGMGGVPKAMAVFDALRESFGDAVKLYVGRVDETLISGVVVIRYRETVEYFTPVVEPTHRDTQALSALIFEVMCREARAGARLWNWGGTWRSQEGVYRFKSRWGAEDRLYRYFNRIDDLTLRDLPRERLAAAFPYFYLYRY